MFKKMLLIGLVALVAGTGCNKATLDDAKDAVAGSPSPSPSPPKPSLRITSPADGDKITGNTVELGFDHAGIEITKADGDTSGKTGHFHVFVDQEPVPVGAAIPKTKGVVHSTDDPIVIPGLPNGKHKLTIVYGDGNHVRITDAESTVNVETTGPTIQVTAPSAITAGQTLRLTVKTQGLTLVKAPQGEAPKSGHLHVLIDLQLPEYAKAIGATDGIIHTTDTSIDLKDLSVGEHVIWIVVGDGGHVPFRPLVADMVKVTVTA